MNVSRKVRPTRGGGLLEPLLARLRARKANQLIPPCLRDGRILDIGCGSFPYFLSHTFFREKFALDRVKPNGDITGDIHWHNSDLNEDTRLPFPDRFFSIVTMLAVVEHLDPEKLESLLSEVYRVLAPGGTLIITTPAAWSDGLLRAMARVNLVSREEIEEHAYAYTLPILGWYFGRAGFPRAMIRFGYFELGLNMWATATRPV
ncbi:MAG: methyltransferase domain-containing protein [Oscillochloridaceae bacterium]|nr:class I SAM-dependent methyltransferase [Chloroflexaceae bacterium]MDW8389400.1 methyltransferase domain-containing protein [Oscillochloridaceae bacterium]